MNDSSSFTPVAVTGTVTPADIDTSKGLVGNWGIVAQHIACNIVLLCQKAQNWTTLISFDELASVSTERRTVLFNILIELCEGGFLTAQGSKEEWFYTVTDKFIRACVPVPSPAPS